MDYQCDAICFGGVQLFRLHKTEFLVFFLFAELSPSFNFSWAEMVFNLDLPRPPTHPTIQESMKMAKYNQT